MRIYLSTFLVCLLHGLSAQYSIIEFKEDKVKLISDVSQASVLYVVIGNEKDPADAALVAAVKNYWKVGEHKFMPRGEFIDKKKKGELAQNTMYIYEWYSWSADLTMNSLELSTGLNNQNSGYYVLTFVGPPSVDPPKKTKGKTKAEPAGKRLVNLSFDLSSTLTNSKEKILEGYFDLMVKYFNNEVSFCQRYKSDAELKKEEKDGIVYFSDGRNEIQTRDILLVKEQVNRAKPSDKKETKRVAAVDAVIQFDPPSKNVYTVYPEDIRMALTKADKKVLLFSNDMLISAQDGSVVAAPQNFREVKEKKDYGFWLSTLGILASAFLLGTLVN